MIQLVRLNNGFLAARTNAPQVSCFDVAGASDDDQEPFGDVPIMQCLGVSSLPAPPTSDGHAEGILVEGVGGLPGIVVAAWDTRTFSLFGRLDAGDTVLHSTGPNQAAQVLCKEEKRQVILATKDDSGEGAMVLVDGKNRKIQLLGWGLSIELSDANGIVLEAGSCRLMVHPDNGVTIQGGITLGGVAAMPGMSMAIAAPPTWAALSALAGPFTPIMAVRGAL